MSLSKSCFGGLFLINDNEVNISFLSNTAKKMILKNYIKYRYILYSNNIIAYE